MTSDERIDRLRTVTIRGTVFSVAGLRELEQQFDRTGQECDSSAHETAAIALRWAARRIEHLEQTISRIRGIADEAAHVGY